MITTVGMLPRRSRRVWSFIAPLCFRNSAQGKSDRQKIDGGGVQGIDRLIQFHAEGIAGVKLSGLGDQDLGEVGINPPVPDLIGIGQGVAGDLSPDAQVIKFGLCCPQTCLDVSQAFPVGQLGEGHAEILVPAGEALDLVVAVVSFYALPEIVDRHKVHQLGEHGSTRVHQPSPSARMQKYGLLQKIFSNRLQPFLPAKPQYLDLLVFYLLNVGTVVIT